MALSSKIYAIEDNNAEDHHYPPVPGYINGQKMKLEKIALKEDVKSDDEQDQEKIVIEENIQKIFVEKIVVEGNQLLTDDEITPITEKYLNKELTIEEINYIASEITELYKSYGIRTALAYLPPQEIMENTVNIKIIEGKIGKITVKGNKFTWGFHLKNAIKQKEGDIVFVPEIEQDILKFNKNNDIKLKATIRKGEELGETDIVLNVEETQPFHLNFSADNSGTYSTGRYKAGTTVTLDSLLGFRDRLTAHYGRSRSVDSVFASYDFPIGYGGTRIGASFGYGGSAVTRGALRDYDVESKIADYALYVTRPLYNGNKYKLFTTGSLNFKENTIFMLGERLDKLGGDPPTHIRTGTISFTGIANDKYGRWVHNSDFILGMDMFGGREQFFKYVGGLQRINLIGKSCVLILKASTQLSDDNLPAIEQIGMGGFSTVRGYPTSYAMGDYGYNFNTEFRFPIIPDKFSRLGKFSLKDKLQGVGFADLGSTFYGNNNMGRDTTLMGLGGGLRVKLSKYLMGRVDYGVGILNKGNDLPFAKLHFAIESAPF